MNFVLIFSFISISGVIAYFAKDTNHKYIGMLLFINFLIMYSYDFLVMDRDAYLLIEPPHEFAKYYAYKLLLTAFFAAGYFLLQAYVLLLISMSILIVLFASVCMSLFGYEISYFGGVMVTLSICQLLAGLTGAVSDNMRSSGVSFRGLRGGFADIVSKAIHK